MIEFEVFHDARNVKTKYTDAANPSDTAIGNVIFYNDADLYNAGDMGSVQGRVQGTCTLVSASPSYYCSFSYQIFNDDSTSVTFTAEGRVDNTDIKGSTLSISGGFNGLEDASGIAVLTPAKLDESHAIPSGLIFDGYLVKFQLLLNYAVAAARTHAPSAAPSTV
jgi:hypothetical protein